MKKINLFLRSAAFICSLIIVSSCSNSDSEHQNPKESLSAFICKNENIVGFGNVDLKGILNKADYSNFPMIGKLLGSEMSTLERIIDLNIPAYYAFEGPFDEDGSPEVTYVFFQVKNADSLVAELMSRGFDVEEKGALKYCQDGDFALGFENKLAIIVTKREDFDAEKLLAESFKMTKGDLKGGKTDEILNAKGDVVIGMNVSTLYLTSNTELSELSEDKQKELKELVADSYIQTVIKFEDGAGIIETKNFFSDKLKEKMFFNADGNAPVLAKLGQGKARFGVAVNLDIKKIQTFMDEYSPSTLKELGRAMGGPAQMALMASGKEGISGLFNGKFGIIMLGDPDVSGAIEPDFNFFIGLGKKGQDLGNLAKEMLSYSMGSVNLDKDGLSGSSNAESASSTNQGIKLPEGCENFGKSGISAFANFEGLNFDEMDLEGEQNIIRVVKYITFDYNSDGGRLYIKAKNGKENVLKQAMEVLIDEFSSEISRIVI